MLMKVLFFKCGCEAFEGCTDCGVVSDGVRRGAADVASELAESAFAATETRGKRRNAGVPVLVECVHELYIVGTDSRCIGDCEGRVRARGAVCGQSSPEFVTCEQVPGWVGVADRQEPLGEGRVGESIFCCKRRLGSGIRGVKVMDELGIVGWRGFWRVWTRGVVPDERSPVLGTSGPAKGFRRADGAEPSIEVHVVDPVLLGKILRCAGKGGVVVLDELLGREIAFGSGADSCHELQQGGSSSAVKPVRVRFLSPHSADECRNSCVVDAVHSPKRHVGSVPVGQKVIHQNRVVVDSERAALDAASVDAPDDARGEGESLLFLSCGWWWWWW